MSQSSFSWFFKPKNDEKTLGVTLGSKDNIKAEIDRMQGSIVKTSKTYQDNLKKYKEIAKLNQQLTKSYVANLKVIADVSELLNSYSGVFVSLKSEFGKMEEALGKPLDITDFEYLQSMTKSKIDDLNTEFIKQTDGLKKLYAQYGKPEELNRILVAQGDIKKVIENASRTYDNVMKDLPQKGGKAKKKPQRKSTKSKRA